MRTGSEAQDRLPGLETYDWRRRAEETLSGLPGMTGYGEPSVQSGIVPSVGPSPSAGQDTASSALQASTSLAQQQAQEAATIGMSAHNRIDEMRDAAEGALSGVQEGLNVLHSRQQATLGTLSGVQQDMSVLHHHQERAHSVASQSERMSSAAVRRVEEMEAARAADRQQLETLRAQREADTARIAQMEKTMMDNVRASEKTMATLQSLQQDLLSARAETSRVQQQLTESQARVASLSAQQSFMQRQQPQQSAQQESTSQSVLQLTADLTRRMDELQAAISSGTPKRTPEPPKESSSGQWRFADPVSSQSVGPSFVIKPKDPPTFSGDKGQDVITWLGMIDDFLELTQPTEAQAVAYTIMALTGNARAWWQSEYQSRGYTRPATIAELKMLIRAAFESPVREQRARTELLRLSQRQGENAQAYMARTKALLTKIPGYDLKMVLHQWVLGLRAPFQVEVAKTYPSTLSEAEAMVSRLEDALDFGKGGRSDSQAKKTQQGGGSTSGQPQQQKKSSGWQGHGGSSTWQGSSSTSQGRGRSSGQGSTGRGFRPPQSPIVVPHPHGRAPGGSGRGGRGRKGRGRTRVAVMATSADELREMADQWDREAGQLPAVEEPDVSQSQGLGN